MLFPETWIIIIAFTAFTIWMLVTEGLLKKILAMVFSILVVAVVRSTNFTYIVFSDKIVKSTSFTYSGSKITSTINTFDPVALTRLTIDPPIEIVRLLFPFFIALTFIALGLFIYEVMGVIEERRRIKP